MRCPFFEFKNPHVYGAIIYRDLAPVWQRVYPHVYGENWFRASD